MRSIVMPLMLAAACLAAAPTAALAERESPFELRPGVGQPLRFRDANGGAFQPRTLILVGQGGALSAPLPASSANARSEDKVDISGSPLIGPLFQKTLDTHKARAGALVGPVYRAGDALVVDAGSGIDGLARRPVTLTTNLPRLGSVSYGVGRLGYRPSAAPRLSGVRIGSAHMVEGKLVLASEGGGPAYPSIEALFENLF